MLNPTSKLIIIINLLLSFSIIFQSFVITIEIFFNHELLSDHLNSKSGWGLFLSIMNYITRLTFIFSCISKTNTGFYEQRKIVMKRSRIFSRYIRSEVLQDLFSIFCMFNGYLILPHKEDLFEVKAALLHSPLNSYKLFFLINMSSLEKVHNYFKGLLCHKMRLDALLSLTKLVFEILVVGHITACLWNLSSEYQERNGISNSWRDKLKFVYNSDFFGWEEYYLYSLYWSISTLITVSFGSIPASNSPEVFVSMITVVVGCCFFAYAVKRVSNIVEDVSTREKPFW